MKHEGDDILCGVRVFPDQIEMSILHWNEWVDEFLEFAKIEQT